MPSRTILALSALLLAACASSRPPLSEAEAEQLDLLGRDRGLRIATVLRRDDGQLEVWTKQGSTRRRYLIVSNEQGVANLEVVPDGFRVR